MDETPRVWAVHDGKVGIRSQVIGLAEALGWPFEEKVVALRFPWNRLPALARSPHRLRPAERGRGPRR
jgi:mitochondrial fission protein ELM1